MSFSQTFNSWGIALAQTLTVWSESFLYLSLLFLLLLGITVRILSFLYLHSWSYLCGILNQTAHNFLEGKYGKVMSPTYHQLLDFIFKQTEKELTQDLDQVTDKESEHPPLYYTRKRWHHFLLGTQGISYFSSEIQNQVRYYSFHKGERPPFERIVHYIFWSNPSFNGLWGIFPLSWAKRFTEALPALLILIGVFGTLVGINKGLPQLHTLHLEKMPEFFKQMSLALNTTIVGIFAAAVLAAFNALLSLKDQLSSITKKVTHAIEFLWLEGQKSSPDVNPRELFKDFYDPQTPPDEIPLE